jgi:hypothetical protein
MIILLKQLKSLKPKKRKVLSIKLCNENKMQNSLGKRDLGHSQVVNFNRKLQNRALEFEQGAEKSLDYVCRGSDQVRDFTISG